MSTEPARIVRVTGFTDDLYALDETGALWSYERRGYAQVWILLPPLPTRGLVADLYIHVSIDPWESLNKTLRVLDNTGKLWELRWCNGEYLWDSISLEAR